MKTSSKIAALFLPLFALLVMYPFQKGFAQQAVVSLTPTYDPLSEPPLPANTTEYELGRNLSWHWCMTCHGDVGQGLTDAFRGIWEEDHQDCWGRGCHAGHPGDMGFPIPTVVPALVSYTHLKQFACLQELSWAKPSAAHLCSCPKASRISSCMATSSRSGATSNRPARTSIKACS